MYSRKSTDNGVTWLPPDTLSDVASPLPLQPDPGIVDGLCGRLRLWLGYPHQARYCVGGRASGHQRLIPAGCLSRIERLVGTPSPTPTATSLRATATATATATRQQPQLLLLQRRHLGRHPRLGLSRHQGLVRLRRPDRKAVDRSVIGCFGTRERASRVPNRGVSRVCTLLCKPRQ